MLNASNFRIIVTKESTVDKSEVHGSWQLADFHIPDHSSWHVQSRLAERGGQMEAYAILS